MKKENLVTDPVTQGEHHMRREDWSDVARSQGMLQTTRSWVKAKIRFFPNLSNMLILEIWLLEL